MSQHRSVKPWFWTVLALLHERPMHPYEIQRLVQQRRKDLFAEHKRGSLYSVIDRLVADQFIEAEEVERQGRWPERTVYRITDAGKNRFRDWLCAELRHLNRQDIPRFGFAVEKLVHLSPNCVSSLFKERLEELEQDRDELRNALGTAHSRDVPRVSLLELEYAFTIREAEISWLQAALNDLHSGTLTWDDYDREEGI